MSGTKEGRFGWVASECAGDDNLGSEAFVGAVPKIVAGAGYGAIRSRHDRPNWISKFQFWRLPASRGWLG